MLDKSIKHGKEYRKDYYKSKRFDRSCRNHGSCDRCRDNRILKNSEKERLAKKDIETYNNTWE